MGAAAAHLDHAVLVSPEVSERVQKAGIETEPGTPAELASYIKEEIARFQNLIKAIGLKPRRTIELRNGSIPCRLLLFDLYRGTRRAARGESTATGTVLGSG